MLYVDDSATGANNGSTWCDAFVYLQDALAAAAASGGAVTETRVAQGVYKPDQGAKQTPTDRTTTFQLLNNVALRGGYAGCGAPDPHAREIAGNETILSGDLNGNGEPVPCTQDSPDCASLGGFCIDNFFIIHANNAENSYHVVTGSVTDGSAVPDGFPMTAGNANGGPPYNDLGGGMSNFSSDPAVTDYAFSGNSAGNGGAPSDALPPQYQAEN